MFISVLLNLVFFIYFLQNFLFLKKNGKSIIIFIIIFILDFLLNHNGATILSKLIIIGLNFFLVVLVFEGKIHKKIIYFIICYFILAVAESLSLKILEKFSIFSSFSEVNVHSELYLFIVLITQLIAFSIGYLISKLLKQDKINMVLFIAIVPLVLTVLFVISFENLDLLIRNERNSFIIFIILIFTSVLSILYQHNYIVSKKQEKDYEINKMKQQLLTSKYDLLQKHYQENFKFLHGLIHSINSLNLLVKNNNINELQVELEKLGDEVFNSFSIIYTNSPVISSLLNERRDIIEKNNIVVSTTLKNTSFEIDLTVQMEIFSKLFDVIIRCCSSCTSKNKVIIIKSKSTNTQVYYSFIFSAETKPNEIYDCLSTFINSNIIEINMNLNIEKHLLYLFMIFNKN